MRTRVAVVGLLACLLGTAIVKAQQSPAAAAPLSDQVFKNVQVMKGIPVDQFMATMGFFSASLGMSCEDCHAADDRNWDGFAADNGKPLLVNLSEVQAGLSGPTDVGLCYWTTNDKWDHNGGLFTTAVVVHS